MKLQEKIYYCRKKAGYSQEALAEQLGVSRQAISKWENGDAEPEIAKLRLLSQSFDVTTDWLLTEDEPEITTTKEKTTYSMYASHHNGTNSNWVDSLPGTIGKLIKRFGWLFGVYVAAIGAGLVFMGGLARYMTRRMMSSFIRQPFFDDQSMFSDTMMDADAFGYSFNSVFASNGTNNPVYIMGSFMLFLGICLMIVGIVLAVVLKKNSNKV